MGDPADDRSTCDRGSRCLRSCARCCGRRRRPPGKRRPCGTFVPPMRTVSATFSSPACSAGQLMAPPDVDAEIAGPLLQQADQPWLRHQQRVHRVVLDVEEAQRHPGEHPAVGGPRRSVVAAEERDRGRACRAAGSPVRQGRWPFGSSLGPGSLSRTTGRTPASASSHASISPLGPAPEMTTSAASTVISCSSSAWPARADRRRLRRSRAQQGGDRPRAGRLAT